jgi:hypothetical protein
MICSFAKKANGRGLSPLAIVGQIAVRRFGPLGHGQNLELQSGRHLVKLALLKHTFGVGRFISNRSRLEMC